MFDRIASAVLSRPRTILTMTVVFIVAAGLFGGGAFSRLAGGGFEDPDAESTKAADVLEEEYGAGSPNVVVLASTNDGSVDDAAAAGIAATEAVAAVPGLTQVVSYWTLDNAPPLRSDRGDRAIIVARASGEEDEINDAVHELRAIIDELDSPLVLEVGGGGAVGLDITEQLERDLTRAEAIAVPLTLLLLIIVFGSVVAGLLPLGVGVVAITGSLAGLSGIAMLTDVSAYSINLTTALGLGLAIDYSLFVVSRFREEMGSGATVPEAVRTTVMTAGRTVAFSALTVAVSLSALLVFPLYFLRSFAYAGVVVVLVAAVASVVSLPALLAILGPRVDKGRILRRRMVTPGEGTWHRLAVAVMKRPVAVAAAVTALLVVLGLPFLGVNFGLPDARVLPESAESRVVTEVLTEEFSADESAAFPIVALAVTDPDAVDAYAADVSTTPGVARVDTLTGSYIGGANVAPASPASDRFASSSGSWLSVVPSVTPISAEGEQLVEALRELDPGFETLVGGQSAALIDSKAAIGGSLPIAIGIIASATFVLLFLMFGSILVPIKALLLNTLSLTATFGAMVWVFQDGNGAGLLGFTATGTTDVAMPILMFCIAFGLSMDYEVFLLSRIKEEHDRTGDNTSAVAVGLERTGGLVTAAAALLAITFLAFGTSQVTFMKMFGLGLALAVVADASIVRATLVPAFMKLAGEANWWAPAPLRKLHDRWGISEAGPNEAPTEAPPAASEPPLVVSGSAGGSRVG